jgi:hypothetical protein
VAAPPPRIEGAAAFLPRGGASPPLLQPPRHLRRGEPPGAPPRRPPVDVSVVVALGYRHLSVTAPHQHEELHPLVVPLPMLGLRTAGEEGVVPSTPADRWRRA